ncbi:MAG: hypothetical protein WA864_24990 [Acetobacteraceae bacterium]
MFLPGFAKLLFSKQADFVEPDKHHNIPHDEFHGQRNYTTAPQQQQP